MKITLVLIGRYKDAAGSPTLELEVTSGETVWHVVDAFIQRYPLFEKDKKYMMLTKNGVFVSRDTPIQSGDTLTIAPPVVSGG